MIKRVALLLLPALFGFFFSGFCEADVEFGPDLVITSEGLTVTQGPVLPGSLFDVSGFTVKNQGTAASGTFGSSYYLSSDPIITPSDNMLFISWRNESSLSPGESRTVGGVGCV
ncbi:MAG: hypothetical protein EHM36_14955, partial [Deltaproteobacteria bacterium]